MCVTGCHEGALQIIDGKAVMVNESYCDGLGACIGDCPLGAITLEEREAEPYSEEAVKLRPAEAPDSEETAKMRLIEASESGCACMVCPSAETSEKRPSLSELKPPFSELKPPLSELKQFPLQLRLLNPLADFLKGADMLLAADCTAFVSGDFHPRFLKGKMLAIACPKLDNRSPEYADKLTAMIDVAKINSLMVLIMEVPCCNGLAHIAQMACRQATRKIPLTVVRLSTKGEVLL